MKPLFYNALLLAVCASPVWAQEGAGVINFNVDEYPIALLEGQAPKQEVTLLACNTKKKIEVSWNELEQVFNVPYGKVAPRLEDGYFVSKYYLASPPVFDQNKNAILGQLIPDRFTFNGYDDEQKPNESIRVTYSVLPPVSLGQINTDFTYRQVGVEESCEDQGVKVVPINIECENFPRIDGKYGASGVGFLENTKPYNTIFIPKYGDAMSNALNCTATILDDIILKHDVTFSNKTRTVNMTALYYNNQPMAFVCKQRKPNDLPKGCQIPD